MSKEEVLVWVTGDWLEGTVDPPLLQCRGEQFWYEVEQHQRNSHLHKMATKKLVQSTVESSHPCSSREGGVAGRYATPPDHGRD